MLLCGGTHITETEDHIPPRTFFRDRKWPDGFVFPACERCNYFSHAAESWLSLILVPPFDEDDTQSEEKLTDKLGAFNERHPELVSSMLPTAREKRQLMRERGLPLPEGMFLDDLPLMTLRHERWARYFPIVGKKLALALHYRTTGRPLSRTGRGLVKAYSNVQMAAGQLPSELQRMVEHFAVRDETTEAKSNGQMRLWTLYRPEADPRVLHVVVLHDMIAFVCTTTEQSDDLPEIVKRHMFAPLTHVSDRAVV